MVQALLGNTVFTLSGWKELSLVGTKDLGPIPLGHPSAPALSTLSHAWNLDWRSVSHMVIHIF